MEMTLFVCKMMMVVGLLNACSGHECRGVATMLLAGICGICISEKKEREK